MSSILHDRHMRNCWHGPGTLIQMYLGAQALRLNHAQMPRYTSRSLLTTKLKLTVSVADSARREVSVAVAACLKPPSVPTGPSAA